MTSNRRGTYSHDEASGKIVITPREGLLRRLDPTAGRLAAFEKVQRELAECTELFENHDDNGRAGVFRAMIAVVEYFTSRGIPNATLAPLSAVASAIADADDGILSPIFTPDMRAPGGKKGQDRLAFEGLLAVVAECCVLHCKAQGMRPFLKPATELAAKLVNRSPLGIKVTAAEMREIRERIAADDAASPRRIAFEIQMASPAARKMPWEFARMLVQHDWVRPA